MLRQYPPCDPFVDWRPLVPSGTAEPSGHVNWSRVPDCETFIPAPSAPARILCRVVSPAKEGSGLHLESSSDFWSLPGQPLALPREVLISRVMWQSVEAGAEPQPWPDDFAGATAKLKAEMAERPTVAEAAPAPISGDSACPAEEWRAADFAEVVSWPLPNAHGAASEPGGSPELFLSLGSAGADRIPHGRPSSPEPSRGDARAER
jgi:hypothetical protein